MYHTLEHTTVYLLRASSSYLNTNITLGIKLNKFPLSKDFHLGIQDIFQCFDSLELNFGGIKVFRPVSSIPTWSGTHINHLFDNFKRYHRSHSRNIWVGMKLSVVINFLFAWCCVLVLPSQQVELVTLAA